MATEEDVRRIALSLPETIEKSSYGTPGFRVKDKAFLRMRSEGSLLVFVGTVDEKEALIASDSKKFSTTPHYDGHPSVIVNLRAVGVKELRELITDAWRHKAPKSILKANPDI